MISTLKGTVLKLRPEVVVVEVGGVGYRVHVPRDTWESVKEGEEEKFWTSTYVRQDRFELYGFLEKRACLLFEALLERPGIGPRLSLELCSTPRALLLQAIAEESTKILTAIKGVGKKIAERLLVELRELLEKHPEFFEGIGAPGSARETGTPLFDQDAIDALTKLGYSTPTILTALRSLPANLQTTEERVAAVLRKL